MVADFLNAAFPWVVMGVGLACVMTYFHSKENKCDKMEDK